MAKLILGCGYLGLRVARRWLDAGDRVHVMTRSGSRCAELKQQGLSAFVGDVTGVLRLPDIQVESLLYAVGFDRTSAPSIRDVYVQGLRNLLDTLPHAPRRVIYVSSTGVYGQTDGSWVDELSPCAPQRAGGRACLDAERELAAHPRGAGAVVLRLSGIYGPSRIPKLKALAAGEPIASAANAYLNLIHIEDAVNVVLATESLAPVPSLFTVSDGHPVRRADFYQTLAELTGSPSPQFTAPTEGSADDQRGGTHKRVSNRRMMEQLQISLKYPTYLDGLAAIVE